MKTITLEDGTTYYPAHEKLRKIKEDGHDYEIHTKYEVINDRVYVKAKLTIFLNHPPILVKNHREYTGMASKPIKLDSALQWCETVAIGRACSAFGIGLEKNYATAEEMKDVENPQMALLRNLVPGTALTLKTTSDAVTAQMKKKTRQKATPNEEKIPTSD